MTRLRLLALLNVSSCWCDDCMWTQVNDIADAIESGDVIACSILDSIEGLHMSRSGAALLKQVPMMPDAMA
jgi:hypothetical protein